MSVPRVRVIFSRKNSEKGHVNFSQTVVSYFDGTNDKANED